MAITFEAFFGPRRFSPSIYNVNPGLVINRIAKMGGNEWRQVLGQSDINISSDTHFGEKPFHIIHKKVL